MRVRINKSFKSNIRNKKNAKISQDLQWLPKNGDKTEKNNKNLTFTFYRKKTQKDLNDFLSLTPAFV